MSFSETFHEGKAKENFALFFRWQRKEIQKVKPEDVPIYWAHQSNQSTKPSSLAKSLLIPQKLWKTGKDGAPLAVVTELRKSSQKIKSFLASFASLDIFAKPVSGTFYDLRALVLKSFRCPFINCLKIDTVESKESIFL